MYSLLGIIVILLWLGLSAAVAGYASKKGEPIVLTFISSVFLSPFLVLIFIFVIRDRKMKNCPICSKKMKMSARVCPRCFTKQK